MIGEQVRAREVNCTKRLADVVVNGTLDVRSSGWHRDADKRALLGRVERDAGGESWVGCPEGATVQRPRLGHQDCRRS